jgi:hypothetical protein
LRADSNPTNPLEENQPSRRISMSHSTAVQEPNIPKGILAGFIATLVLSALMIMKTMMGVMPQLDVIAMLSSMLGVSSVIAWIVHFAIGTLGYGITIALLARSLPGSAIVIGLVLGIAGWLVMMVVLMPMTGKSLFGMDLGIMAPMMTLVLHLIFGAVLGWVYGKTTKHIPAHRDATAARNTGH